MRTTTALLLSSGLAMAQTTPPGTPLGNNGMLIGANTETGSADKEGITGWKDAAKVKTVIRRDFGLVQTTAYPAWGAWTGSGMSNVGFDIAAANEVINWAEGQGKKTAVHLLTGSPTYFPAWLNGGTWTPSELESLLDRWITHAMTSNGNAGKVDYWNVVNEAFMWNGNYWDSSSVANTNPWHGMGWEADKSGLTGTPRVYTHHPVYIRRAFEMARKHSNAKLELRDYGIEFWDNSRKSRAFYQLVKHLVNSGVPIDAVGFQGHFRTDATYNWANLTRAIQEYRKLGLEVYVTEIDYGDTDPIAAATSAHRTPAYDSLQGRNLRAFANAAASGGASWLCFWGVADNTNLYWRMGQSALLYDESYNAKFAYDQVRQGIVEGLATTGANRRSAGSRAESVRIRDGRIVVQGRPDGRARLVNTAGTIVADLELRQGAAHLPALGRGLYVLHAPDARSLPVLIGQ